MYTSQDLLASIALLGGFACLVWAVLNYFSKNYLQQVQLNYLVSKLLKVGDTFSSAYPKDADGKVAVRLAALSIQKRNPINFSGSLTEQEKDVLEVG